MNGKLYNLNNLNKIGLLKQLMVLILMPKNHEMIWIRFTSIIASIKKFSIYPLYGHTSTFFCNMPLFVVIASLYTLFQPILIKNSATSKN